MATRAPPVGVDHLTTVPSNLHEAREADGEEGTRGDDEDALPARSSDADR